MDIKLSDAVKQYSAAYFLPTNLKKRILKCEQGEGLFSHANEAYEFPEGNTGGPIIGEYKQLAYESPKTLHRGPNGQMIEGTFVFGQKTKPGENITAINVKIDHKIMNLACLTVEEALAEISATYN